MTIELTSSRQRPSEHLIPPSQRSESSSQAQSASSSQEPWTKVAPATGCPVQVVAATRSDIRATADQLAQLHNDVLAMAGLLDDVEPQDAFERGQEGKNPWIVKPAVVNLCPAGFGPGLDLAGITAFKQGQHGLEQRRTTVTWNVEGTVGGLSNSIGKRSENGFRIGAQQILQIVHRRFVIFEWLW